MLYLHFKENRLLVGNRLRDWSLVWYAPVGSGDDDGTAPIGLYSSHSGLQTREPMEGEVTWIPFFDPSSFHAKTKRERERMQKQFIYDSYRYMAERKPENLDHLEVTLDQPGYTRWQEWFEILKAEKEVRRRRRQHRTAVLEDAGLNVNDAEISSDLSDNEVLPQRFQRPGFPLTPGTTPSRKRRSDNSQSGRHQRPKPSPNTGGGTNINGGPIEDLGLEDEALYDASPPEDPGNYLNMPNIPKIPEYGNGIHGTNGGGGGSHHGPFQVDDDNDNENA